MTIRITIAMLLFGVLFVAMQLLQLSGIDLYLRDSTLVDHEYYRLVSGHLVHTNWPHLVMNALALLIMLLLFPTCARLPLLALCVVWNALFISAGILLLFRDIAWYVGFSGVVHGLLVTGAILHLREGVAKLLLLILIGKVGWELFSGGATLSAQLIESPVIYESHLLGLIAGAIIALPFLIYRSSFLPGEKSA